MRALHAQHLLPCLLLPVAVAAACADDPNPPDDPVVVDPSGTQTTVISDVRPPAITGGTLLASKSGLRLVVSDPDRDRVLVVDAANQTVLKEIAVAEGAMPGRAVEDAEGRAHVVLRSANKLLTLDLATGDVLSERGLCAAPRGLAVSSFPDAADSVVVACASGELMELEAAPGGAVLARESVGADLRDVVVLAGESRETRAILVSTFRSAEVLRVGPDFEVEGTGHQGRFDHPFLSRSFAATVAWRLVATPEGDGALMVHQRSATTEVVINDEDHGDDPTPDGGGDDGDFDDCCADCDCGGGFGGSSGSNGGYGGDVFECGDTIVNASTTSFDANGQPTHTADTGGLGTLLLPVDVALREGGATAVVAAGSDTVVVTDRSSLVVSDGCVDNFVNGVQLPIGPEPTAAAWLEDASSPMLVVQLREPSTLIFYDANTLEWKDTLALGGALRIDSGHQLFHRNPEFRSTISCASCHPEGREDGHTWQFSELGLRRTQSLEGNIMGTAPFHWDGDQTDLDELMVNVFQHRMGGVAQSGPRVDALKSWLETLPVVEGVEQDSDAVQRGKELFESERTQCATCHAGAKGTKPGSFDVGTGKAFQVPALVGLRNRAPYMHDGCAVTLHDRFDVACGGENHGNVSDLSDGEVDDLVAYMLSL